MNTNVRLLNGPNIRQIKAYSIVNSVIFCCAVLLQVFLATLNKTDTVSIPLGDRISDFLGSFLLLQVFYTALIFKQLLVLSGFLGWAATESKTSTEAYFYASYGFVFPLAGSLIISSSITTPSLILSGMALAYSLPILHARIWSQFC